MAGPRLDDLSAFAAVADAGSFTRAAARLGTSQSTLSRTIGDLETRLGIRLLHRTTRSVAPTQAGEALLRDLRPALSSIDEALAKLGCAGPQLTGSLKLTTSRHAYQTVLRPALPSLLAQNPLVVVEIGLDDAFVDIVAGGFDAGLRLGELVEKDMVAVRIGVPLVFAVVGSAEFCSGRALPATPRALAGERCIAFRAPSSTGIMPWAFEDDGARLNVRVASSLTLNDGESILQAALDGVGFAYLFLDQVEPHLASGRLVRVLERYCPTHPGYHLYYPSTRQQLPVLAALIKHLRQ